MTESTATGDGPAASGRAGIDPESNPAEDAPRTMLVSRTVVTWIELVIVGFLGAALAGQTGGPPQLVIYLSTTLLSVGVLLYNVDRLIAARTN